MRQILIKTPQCEINFDDLCDKEYQKINNLMNLIEKSFSTDMNKHPEIRHEVLDISNFIKRLPSMISEVIE
jgi:hypothetical protein